MALGLTVGLLRDWWTRKEREYFLSEECVGFGDCWDGFFTFLIGSLIAAVIIGAAILIAQGQPRSWALPFVAPLTATFLYPAWIDLIDEFGFRRFFALTLGAGSAYVATELVVGRGYQWFVRLGAMAFVIGFFVAFYEG
jgi:hypothetical protein